MAGARGASAARSLVLVVPRSPPLAGAGGRASGRTSAPGAGPLPADPPQLSVVGESMSWPQAEWE
eukprot:13672496-Alexandrium_andersonii.AAC.1